MMLQVKTPVPAAGFPSCPSCIRLPELEELSGTPASPHWLSPLSVFPFPSKLHPAQVQREPLR